jgi:hypothetical protein
MDEYSGNAGSAQMIDDAVAYRIYPPLDACVRWALKMYLWVVIFTVVFTVAGRLLRGQPVLLTNLLKTSEMIVVLFPGAFALALLIYVICRVWGATFKDGSLRATTFSGRMAKVPLSSITEVRPDSISSLPVLVIKSSSSRAVLYIYTLGLDRNFARIRLSSLAGSENPLTKAFGSKVV